LSDKSKRKSFYKVKVRELNVLELLAKEGKLSTYQIEKKTQSSRYLIKKLEQMKLIKKFGEYKNEKGVIAKTYGLTLYGLAEVMTLRNLWNYTDKIVENWRELDPLVFGNNWDKLKNTFQRENVVEALKDTFSMLLNVTYLWHIASNSRVKDFLKKTIPTFFPFEEGDTKDYEKLIEFTFSDSFFHLALVNALMKKALKRY